mmetsp:Transcript_15354/g.43253  ORF Transcript_15354/g.43253 Transcript_15354/m.43253 type:complete len:230 (-) Transcript_15354:296-985(-)|eukprot:CAMPEP_0119556660 /NCGR_PEP_ID=MMETSP1352-20130426/8534_1 /TAXON_ID=265584 /ORGANISM="Stauroneis constricta, Strain CCMP1120" /LENGTH=229 /DNA_ID=CAMNT_0007603639 /DNA_START=85 /DNA_END=774 /DNA_ORIENTATION=+
MTTLSPRPNEHVMIMTSPTGGSETTSYGRGSPMGSIDSNISDMYRAAITPEYQPSPHGSIGSSSSSPRSVPSGLALPSDLGIKKKRSTSTSPSNVERKDLFLRREIVANKKALALMDQTVNPAAAAAMKMEADTESLNKTRPSKKQAAANRQKSKLKYQAAKYSNEPRRVSIKAKEKLAETSRSVKIISAEDEFETIADFKCQMDLDREEDATKKALRMLNNPAIQNVC